MEKYCFCFDIDGTLLTSQHKVSDLTIQTLNRLQKKGHKIIIATGRNYASTKELDLFHQINWDAYVFNNGQCVLDHDLKEIHVEKMPHELVQKIIDISNQEGRVCLLERVYDWFIIQEPDKYVVESHKFLDSAVPEQKEYDPSMEIVMALVYAPEDYDYQPFTAIKGIRVDRGVGMYADLVQSAFHKYKGIEKCLEYFNIKKSVCFGDGSNDIDMIREATIGVAMGQGVQEVKDVSDLVTKSCDDEGITYACERLGFLNDSD